MTIKNEEVARAAGLSKEEGQLAINGGSPVRTQPLPLEFPGIHYMDEEEIEAATRVLRDRSPFRYYGVKLRDEVEHHGVELRGLGRPVQLGRDGEREAPRAARPGIAAARRHPSQRPRDLQGGLWEGELAQRQHVRRASALTGG